MKPAIVADEMFPEGAGPYMDLEEAGGSSGLLMDLTANEKAVHADFFNVHDAGDTNLETLLIRLRFMFDAYCYQQEHLLKNKEVVASN
ncbi:hypothetical protein NQ318_001464 [Aromia moschata]|uniref:COP9 signalosome complex subunit 9 n=2 Tax=Cerambycidae TaxID=34667 RepID=A0AAV8YUE2_9CUCU|nr:hypothetical protein NQ318_001464 [Aromia moschata]